MLEVRPAWQVSWPFDHDRPVWAAGEVLVPGRSPGRLSDHGAGPGAAIWYAPVDGVELAPAGASPFLLEAGHWILSAGPREQRFRAERRGVRLGFLWSPGLERLTPADSTAGPRDLPAAALAVCDRLHQCLYCPIPGRFGCWRLSVRMLELILAVEESAASHAPPAEPVDPAVNAALRIVELADGEYPTAHELAARVGLSHSQFARRFHAAMGMNFREFLSRFRLQRARALLEVGEGNVTDAALASGYSSVSQFSRAFRRHFGRPPSEFLDRRGA